MWSSVDVDLLHKLARTPPYLYLAFNKIIKSSTMATTPSPIRSRKFRVTFCHNRSTRSFHNTFFVNLGTPSPQQGPSTTVPPSPSQLRNRGGAAASSSIFVAGGVRHKLESLRIMT